MTKSKKNAAANAAASIGRSITPSEQSRDKRPLTKQTGAAIGQPGAWPESEPDKQQQSQKKQGDSLSDQSGATISKQDEQAQDAPPVASGTHPAALGTAEGTCSDPHPAALGGTTGEISSGRTLKSNMAGELVADTESKRESSEVKHQAGSRDPEKITPASSGNSRGSEQSQNNIGYQFGDKAIDVAEPGSTPYRVETEPNIVQPGAETEPAVIKPGADREEADASHIRYAGYIPDRTSVLQQRLMAREDLSPGRRLIKGDKYELPDGETHFGENIPDTTQWRSRYPAKLANVNRKDAITLEPYELPFSETHLGENIPVYPQDATAYNRRILYERSQSGQQAEVSPEVGSVLQSTLNDAAMETVPSARRVQLVHIWNRVKLKNRKRLIQVFSAASAVALASCASVAAVALVHRYRHRSGNSAGQI